MTKNVVGGSVQTFLQPFKTFKVTIAYGKSDLMSGGNN